MIYLKVSKWHSYSCHCFFFLQHLMKYNPTYTLWIPKDGLIFRSTCSGLRGHSLSGKNWANEKRRGQKEEKATSIVLYVFPVFADLAKAAMSQFCTMPTGERKKRAAAICQEVHGTNGMTFQPRLVQTHCCKRISILIWVQGDSPAFAINKQTQLYTTSGGFAVVLFKYLFLERGGKLRGPTV